MKFPEIPVTWLVAGLGLGLVIMRYMSIDSWTTAALSSLMGYLLGNHIGLNNACLTSPQIPPTGPQNKENVVTNSS